MWERPLRNEVLQTGSTASPAIPRNGHSKPLQPRILPPRIDWLPDFVSQTRFLTRWQTFLHAGKRRFQPFHVQPLSWWNSINERTEAKKHFYEHRLSTAGTERDRKARTDGRLPSGHRCVEVQRHRYDFRPRGYPDHRLGAACASGGNAIH